jgi:nucleoside-diphosphate-sugar epimerase
VAEEGEKFRDIAAVIGRRLGLPVAGKTPEEAAAHFGWFTHFAAMNSPASSRRTRDLLGWEPRESELIADLDGPRYFPA